VAFGTLRSFVLTVRFGLLRNSSGQHFGKRRLARAGCGARAASPAMLDALYARRSRPLPARAGDG
jgi:hypothetical protein